MSQGDSRPQGAETGVVDAVLPSGVPTWGGQATARASEDDRGPNGAGHRSTVPFDAVPIPMLPFKIVAAIGVAGAFGLSGWQISRVIDEQQRLAVLSFGSLVAAIIAAFAIVTWTFVVAENARRVLSPARTQELPNPATAAASWFVPLMFIGGASASVTYLSRRLNTPIEGTESSVPLMLAIGAIIVALPLMYWPAATLTTVIRKVGGHGVRLAPWLLVPVVLGAVGAAMVFGLRAGGAFGDDTDALAPTWVVAVAAVVPASIVVLLGWRAATVVEADVSRAFDRRFGTGPSSRLRPTHFSRFRGSDGPNHLALSERGHVRQIPGAAAFGALLTAGVAGLAMLSVVGAGVMFLFWQEGRDGLLLPRQSQRAWDVLGRMQAVERTVAIALVAVAALWATIAVANVRFASARRRNPILAGASWPLAAAGVWVLAGRFVNDGTAGEVVVGFALQAAVLLVPFAIMKRAAVAVGSVRSPFSLVYGLSVVLLVHLQGLGGLSTLSANAEPAEFAKLTGYLVISAVVQLTAIFAVTEGTRTIVDAASYEAEHHNMLVEQRASIVSVKPTELAEAKS